MAAQPAFQGRTVREQQEDYERRQAQRELEQWVALDDLGILDFSQFHEDRLPAVEWMVDKHFMKGTVALVSGDGGIGKCLGRGTPILMYDGTIMSVENIRRGDILMGPDSRPRLVRETSSGIGPLFRVTPVKGDPYVVNGNHVLSLKLWAKTPQRQFDFPVNLSIRQYLALPKEKKRALMGWRSGCDWPERSVEVPPYLLGLWLGDGSSGSPTITSADAEESVIPAMEEYGAPLGLYVRSFKREDQGAATTYRLRGQGGRNNPNPLVQALRRYGVYTDKKIPHGYLANSATVRRELLAGLIDTDGHLLSGCYEITQKRQILAEQIAFLARSLGLAAYIKLTMKRSQISELRPYYRVQISGDISQIPVRIARKKAAPRRQKKNPLVTSIAVEPIGDGEYFGFEVSGDHLFMLGDFTVTHNSTLMQQLATCATLGLPWLGFEVEKGPALMLACEDDYIQLLHRHKAIVRSLGIGWKDAWNHGLQVWPRVGQDNILYTIGRHTDWKMAPTHWGERIGLRCKRQGIKYLIVDTATQTFDGNQNDERPVMQYISGLRQLALAMEGVVIITKHPSLSGRALGTGESGNTAWNNSVRSRFYLHYEKLSFKRIEAGDKPRLLWKGMKQNYGSRGNEIPLVWRNGVFVIDEPEAAYADRWFQG